MSITVTRTTVIRVHQELDEIGCRQLERILDDLVVHQGTSDLIVDLSHAGRIDKELKTILDTTKTNVSRLGGVLEVRTPAEPTTELLDIVEDVTTFAPVDLVAAEGHDEA
ncbi:MAG: hypothetical protein AAGK32_11635 [Actinomycetota bacterium]